MWHHISGTLNFADLLIRGCSTKQLVERKWRNWPDRLCEWEEIDLRRIMTQMRIWPLFYHRMKKF